MDLLEKRGYEERIEELEEEVRQLKAMAFNGDKLCPREWGLTGAEEDLMLALLAHPLCSRERLLAAREARVPGAGDILGNCIEVWVTRMRRKGMPVKTARGRGYYLDPVDRERLSALLR